MKMVFVCLFADFVFFLLTSFEQKVGIDTSLFMALDKISILLGRNGLI